MSLNSIAPLQNVANFFSMIDRVNKRTASLPGMAAFYGKSGLGKSMAAIFGANKTRAYYVQVKSLWTRKRFCQAILKEMGLSEVGTLAEMLDSIAEELATSNRPLIIDEADFLIHKGMVEIVRDIYESSFGAIVLIGEEKLPYSLKKWERVHNRILMWQEALPCTLADTQLLASIYCHDIKIQDDLLEAVNSAVNGCTRRVVVNLDHIREYCTSKGLTEINASVYKGRIDTGSPWR